VEGKPPPSSSAAGPGATHTGPWLVPLLVLVFGMFVSLLDATIVTLLRWREANPVPLPVYAGVMVLASAGMAKRLAASIPDIEIADRLVEQVDANPAAGVDAACEQVLALRETGAFAGVHLVPVNRFREVAAILEISLQS
jgi:hypothetical protein